MGKVLKELDFLKQSSSVLTINPPQSVKVPESTSTSSKMQEEHLSVAVLCDGAHPAILLIPVSYSARTSRAKHPNNHMPSLSGS